MFYMIRLNFRRSRSLESDLRFSPELITRQQYVRGRSAGLFSRTAVSGWKSGLFLYVIQHNSREIR